MFKHLAIAAAALGFAAAVFAAPAAQAQDVPSYAQPAPNDEAQLRGRISGFDGGYSLQVRDERGYVDQVRLHPGTIINPTGLTLAPGMTVSVLGYNAGSYFAANEIDTPYTFNGGVPYYAGRPWNYYGPQFSIGFFFGNGGWWHGPYFHGGYRFYGGTRVYDGVRVTNVYRGGSGSFHGRDYVAPRASGGYYHESRRGDSHSHSDGHSPR